MEYVRKKEMKPEMIKSLAWISVECEHEVGSWLMAPTQNGRKVANSSYWVSVCNAHTRKNKMT